MSVIALSGRRRGWPGPMRGRGAPPALLGIGPGRDRPVRPANGSPFWPRGGGLLVGAEDGAVDLDERVDAAGRVRPGLDLLQGAGEHVVERVTAEAGSDRLPRPHSAVAGHARRCRYGACRFSVDYLRPSTQRRPVTARGIRKASNSAPCRCHLHDPSLSDLWRRALGFSTATRLVQRRGSACGALSICLVCGQARSLGQCPGHRRLSLEVRSVGKRPRHRLLPRPYAPILFGCHLPDRRKVLP